MAKKARQVEIPDDRALTFKEFEDLKNHAMASSMWYSTTYVRNTEQMKEKLYGKGYWEDEVTATDEDGQQFTYNIVDKTVDRLVELEMVNDFAYAEGIVHSRLRQGSGISKIRMDLVFKKVPADIIDKVLDGIEEEESDEALEKALSRVLLSSSYRKIDEPRQKKQKLTHSLLNKGFSFDAVSVIVSRVIDEE